MSSDEKYKNELSIVWNGACIVKSTYICVLYNIFIIQIIICQCIKTYKYNMNIKYYRTNCMHQLLNPNKSINYNVHQIINELFKIIY